MVYYYEIINQFDTVQWSSIFAKVKTIENVQSTLLGGHRRLTINTNIAGSNLALLLSLYGIDVYLDKALYLHCLSLSS